MNNVSLGKEPTIPNFSEEALTRIGRMLNQRRTTGHLLRLAVCAGTTRKTLQNWTADPDDGQFRAMSGTAKRCVTLLAYFAMTGALTPDVMEDVIELERALENESRFNAIATRVAAVIEEENW